MNIFKTKIVSHTMVSTNYLLVKVEALTKGNVNLGLPGQFYEIKPLGDNFQLRVPISIYDVEKQYISFLIKIVGEKTKRLQGLKAGDELDILGPLGNTFETEEDKKYLFVSGGAGYAPLNYLYSAYTHPTNITWIHGGRNKEEVHFARTAERTIICTDDGSVGVKGLVTDEALKAISTTKFDKAFTCGPVPMMKALFEICQSANIPLIVSLEEYMGCGVGVCYGCAVKIKSESGAETYVRVCKTGPVFEAKNIVDFVSAGH